MATNFEKLKEMSIEEIAEMLSTDRVVEDIVEGVYLNSAETWAWWLNHDSSIDNETRPVDDPIEYLDELEEGTEYIEVR